MINVGSMLSRMRVWWMVLAAVGPISAFAAHAQTDALFPSKSLPNVSPGAAGDYYIDLLKWSQTVKMGPLTARVIYLDPPLYLAWLSQSDPGVTQAELAEKLGGFPRILRFRVAFQATNKADIQAKQWKLALTGSNSGAISMLEGHRVAPMDVESGPNGNYWEVDWDYSFAVPDNFLADSKGFDIALSSPAGDGRASWQFGAQSTASAEAGGYVVALGSSLLLLCILLLAALFVTRPPGASTI